MGAIFGYISSLRPGIHEFHLKKRNNPIKSVPVINDQTNEVLTGLKMVSQRKRCVLDSNCFFIG